MNQIIVDDSFVKQLSGATSPCMVFDSGGKRIGYFTPEVDSAWYQRVHPSVSDDELDRRERLGGGRTLAEILTDLEKRQ